MTMISLRPIPNFQSPDAGDDLFGQMHIEFPDRLLSNCIEMGLFRSGRHLRNTLGRMMSCGSKSGNFWMLPSGDTMSMYLAFALGLSTLGKTNAPASTPSPLRHFRSRKILGKGRHEKPVLSNAPLSIFSAFKIIPAFRNSEMLGKN